MRVQQATFVLFVTRIIVLFSFCFRVIVGVVIDLLVVIGYFLVSTCNFNSLFCSSKITRAKDIHKSEEQGGQRWPQCRQSSQIISVQESIQKAHLSKRTHTRRQRPRRPR